MRQEDIVIETYAKHNLKVFPVEPNGKHPLAKVSWKIVASDNKYDIKDWFNQVPNINIGLPANLNNLFIIDIDNHNGCDGIAEFKKLLDSIGIKKIDTLKQVTPSNGLHLIFKSDEDLRKVKNAANFFKVIGYNNLDIRSEGYIVCYPSIRDGKSYKLLGSIEDIKEMPKQLKDLILSINNQSKNEDYEIDENDFYIEGKVINKGSRDQTMFMYINELYNHKRLNIDEIRLLASAFNRRCFNPPLNQHVVDDKIARICKKKRRKRIEILLDEEE